MFIFRKKIALTALIMTITALALSGCFGGNIPGIAPTANTQDVTAAESKNMSCDDIRTNIKSLKDYIGYYEDVESVVSLFSSNSMAASSNLVNQAKIRLRKIENLQVIRKC